MPANVQDFLGDGGRIFRRRSGNRTITVAYFRCNGQIAYGATIHRKESTSDQWDRKAHNSTAVSRCVDLPIIVSDIEVERVEQRDDFVRDCLISHGCFTPAAE